MIDLSKAIYFEESEEVVEILVNSTQNDSPLFFRIMVAYYFAELASMMRVHLDTLDRGKIPINVYALNLANSGFGKTMSSNILEQQVIGKFKEKYTTDTIHKIAQKSLINLALERATISGQDPEEVLELVESEFEKKGNYAFSFSESSSPAAKQLREKYLMAGTGSLNFIVDEIGSHIVNNKELFGMFLDVYDTGLTKQKLTKISADNKRSEEVKGHVPANLLAFGTPSKLFNGSKEEEEIYSLLDTGYARRFLFGLSNRVPNSKGMTAEEVFNALTDKTTENKLEALSDRLESLADESNHGMAITMCKDVSIALIQYRMDCEAIANEFPNHEEIRKTEISHRYFKAMKLAGAYTFIRGTNILTMDILLSAIKLVEESGEAFAKILTRDKNYVRLAKYLADHGSECTQADLLEDLVFYKGSVAARQDMVTLATAYGVKNNISIKRRLIDGIEFISGDSLTATDLNEVYLSYSTKLAHEYIPEKIKFTDIHRLTQANGYHWANHCFLEGHRSDSKAIKGFNLVVIDVDGGIALETAQMLLKDYTYHMYTTKRHTNESNRFRIVFPMNYILKIDSEEYQEFMHNIYSWLPFNVDDCTDQRSRKWLSYEASYYYNEGKLLDVLSFIPRTAKAEEFNKQIVDLGSIDKVEAWFIRGITSKGQPRNNTLIKYALMLTDGGMDLNQIRDKVFLLNSKLPDKLSDEEITSTILVTVASTINKRD